MAAHDDDDLVPLEGDDPPHDDGRPTAGRGKARRLFFELIKDCGTDVVRMPSSCQVYLGRYLAAYPDEADLLVAALRQDVPRQLLAYETVGGYSDFLDARIEDLAGTLAHDDARWAVETWATALGRPRGFKYRPPEVDPADQYPDPERDTRYDNFVKAAMLFIVGVGGFFGTFLGVLLVPVILWAAEFRLAALQGDMVGHMQDQENANDLAIFLLAFVVAGGSGIVGAAAAITGWLFGGGDEKPWATASVASGAAFASVFTCLGAMMVCCVPPLFFPFIHIVCVFGATYKSAARGGNY